MSSHRDILSLWPAQTDLIADLRAEGVEIGQSGVAMWSVRDDIPSHYWPALVAAGARRGYPVTLEGLASSQRKLRERA